MTSFTNSVFPAEEDFDNLYDWLNSIEFSRPKKNLARDFSDGVLVAEILKKFYPRLVELHNYYGANRLSAKMENWITLDRKVLVHLGLSEPKQVYQDMANACKGAVEVFLVKLKNKIERDEAEKQENKEMQFYTDGLDDGFAGITPSIKEYNNLIENLKGKEEEIRTLQIKVSHLESLVQLKEQRLQDTAVQLKRCWCRGEGRPWEAPSWQARPAEHGAGDGFTLKPSYPSLTTSTNYSI